MRLKEDENIVVHDTVDGEGRGDYFTKLVTIPLLTLTLPPALPVVWPVRPPEEVFSWLKNWPAPLEALSILILNR